MKFTALLHHMTVALLRDSFYALKRKAAPGVDSVTWQEYETGLEGRLADLHSRVHRGATERSHQEGCSFRNRMEDNGRSGSHNPEIHSSILTSRKLSQRSEGTVCTNCPSPRKRPRSKNL